MRPVIVEMTINLPSIAGAIRYTAQPLSGFQKPSIFCIRIDLVEIHLRFRHGFVPR
jgi:hypothetical protein